MYFEPSKKTYYRFPNTSHIYDTDYKYYYPETDFTNSRPETLSSIIEKNSESYRRTLVDHETKRNQWI